MKDLILTREELDDIENSPIFVLWLYSNIDESKLTEKEKQIIIAKQMYYDLKVPDEMIYYALNKANCNSYDELLKYPKVISELSRILNVREDYIRTKLTLMQKRKIKELELKLKREK